MLRVRGLRVAGAAAALLCAGTLTASAALLDFTDDAAYTVQTGASASGTISGTGWSLTPFGGNLTFATPGPGATGVLAGDNDGVGVGNDEITTPEPPGVAEYVVLEFDRKVKITGLYFLDLFRARRGGTAESAFLYEGDGIGGAVLGQFEATEVYVQGGKGYGAFTSFGTFTGTTFTFDAGPFNDNVGLADYALAGVEIAPVPLPAGFLLLGTALAGLGFARRKA